MIIITIKVHILRKNIGVFHGCSTLYPKLYVFIGSAMRVGLCRRSRTSNLLSQRLLNYKPLNTSARMEFCRILLPLHRELFLCQHQDFIEGCKKREKAGQIETMRNVLWSHSLQATAHIVAGHGVQS